MQTNDTREIIYQSSENKNETQCIVTQGEDFNLPGVICFFSIRRVSLRRYYVEQSGTAGRKKINR